MSIRQQYHSCHHCDNALICSPAISLWFLSFSPFYFSFYTYTLTYIFSHTHTLFTMFFNKKTRNRSTFHETKRVTSTHLVNTIQAIKDFKSYKGSYKLNIMLHCHNNLLKRGLCNLLLFSMFIKSIVIIQCRFLILYNFKIYISKYVKIVFTP